MRLVGEGSHGLVVDHGVEEAGEDAVVGLVDGGEQGHAPLHDGQRERDEGGHRHEGRPEVGLAVAPAEEAHDQRRLEEGGQEVEEQQPQQRTHAAHAAREDARELARRLLRQPRRVERLHVREGVGHEAPQRVLPDGREGQVAQLLQCSKGGGVKTPRCTVRRCSAVYEKMQ